MSTVYTLNGKVLKNAANDKWLTKKEAPAGFVMDASNATYTQASGDYWASWQSPTYPDCYNGNGKQYVLVNNNATGIGGQGGGVNLFYGQNIAVGGPTAIGTTDIIKVGTNTGVLSNNPAADSGFGSYFTLPLPGDSDHKFTTLEQVQAYMANVSITILDP